jgi:hypothetical protein
MAIVFTDFVKKTLGLRCFGFVASFDGNKKRSEMTRVFGYSLDEPAGILTVLVYKGDSAKLLACLSQTKKLTVVNSDPMSFKTLQIKGDFLSHSDASPEEINLIKNEFGNRRTEVFTMFGLPASIGDNLNSLPALSIKMQCKEIFDQTPRLNTGNKIS